MRLPHLFFSIALCLLAFAALAQETPPPITAIEALQQTQPSVAWDNKTAAAGDFSCNGKTDTAMLGFEKDEAVWLGVVSGAEAKPLTLKFLVDKHSQEAVCSSNVKIQAHPQACTVAQNEPLPGYEPGKGCSAFDLVDDACDAFHFYWDNSKKMLRSWRG